LPNQVPTPEAEAIVGVVVFDDQVAGEPAQDAAGGGIPHLKAFDLYPIRLVDVKEAGLPAVARIGRERGNPGAVNDDLAAGVGAEDDVIPRRPGTGDRDPLVVDPGFDIDFLTWGQGVGRPLDRAPGLRLRAGE